MHGKIVENVSSRYPSQYFISLLIDLNVIEAVNASRHLSLEIEFFFQAHSQRLHLIFFATLAIVLIISLINC